MINAGPVLLEVSYSSTLPAAEWRAGSMKPLRVTIRGYNPRNRKQKVYLKKVALTVTPTDDRGPTEPDVVLTDASELSPGYYIRSPSDYKQTFVIPALSSGPTALSIYASFEILLEIDRAARDYSKQSGDDELVVTLSE